MKPKSINSLMKYLRDYKHINISGSSDKLKLSNIGYYHGYKGYRYIFNPQKQINFKKYLFKSNFVCYNIDTNVNCEIM